MKRMLSTTYVFNQDKGKDQLCVKERLKWSRRVQVKVWASLTHERLEINIMERVRERTTIRDKK